MSTSTKTTSYRWIVNQGQDESLAITLTNNAGTKPDLSSSTTAQMNLKTSYAGSAAVKVYSYTIAAGGSVTFASRPTENETITLVSTNGTSKTFVAKDTALPVELTKLTSCRVFVFVTTNSLPISE